MSLGTEIALIKALGGGSSLPTVTSADAGKVLGVNDSGVWGAQEPIGKPFIVTLTPTAADYSGTMDKTVAEIDAAYKAGRKIVYNIAGNRLDVTAILVDGDYDYNGYGAFGILNNLLLLIFTQQTNDGTIDTYSVSRFALTPAT